MRIYWNEKDEIEESKKYVSKTDFHKSKSGAYLYARKHNLLSKMIWLKQPKWNNKTVINESKKYTSRGEFAKCSNGAYHYAREHNLLDKMVWLKPKNLFGSNAQKIDIVYAYEFIPHNVVYIGRSIDIDRRDKQHRTREKDTVGKFAKENNADIPKMKILEENITILDGQKLEKEWLDKYAKNGWKILNKGKCGEGCGSLGVLNTINRKWNNTNVIEESKKYTSKVQFKKNSNGAYNYARRHKLLHKMVWLKKPDVWNKKWKDNETVINESKNFKSKSEFKRKNRGAYEYARKYGLLEKMIWLFPKNK